MDFQQSIQLVLRAKAGDRSAFSELIDLYQTALFRFCFYLCRDQSRAEDLSQNTLIKAFEKIHKLQEAEKFRPWLFQIARHEFLDFVRSHKREEIRPIADDEVVQTPHEQDLEVREILAALDSDSQICLVLVDMEGYSYAEAAEIIGISEDALRSRLHRARKEFLDKYEKTETLKLPKASTL
ncbi:MAG: RNA polymerase sigma factor [Deltaproteobacteria bacterium]|nr:RNA polymerase sigma factor [Deltaproteobacteria bacterium]